MGKTLCLKRMANSFAMITHIGISKLFTLSLKGLLINRLLFLELLYMILELAKSGFYSYSFI